MWTTTAIQLVTVIAVSTYYCSSVSSLAPSDHVTHSTRYAQKRQQYTHEQRQYMYDDSSRLSPTFMTLNSQSLHNHNNNDDDNNNTEQMDSSVPSSVWEHTNDADAYARALEAQALPPTNTWWSSTSQLLLPFECTSCGKCCQTQGSVWMSPLETRNAAQLLNLSTEAFISEYASHILSADDDHDDHDSTTTTTTTTAQVKQVWIQLKNDPTGTACVFLQDDKKCRIYEARPVQCSTYPFWTNVMESEAAWDEEVRFVVPGGDLPPLSSSSNTNNNDDDDDISGNGGGPYWTPEGGGCEGMQYIGSQHSHDNDNNHPTGVSIAEAHAKLQAYEWEERRFPKNLTGMRAIPHNL